MTENNEILETIREILTENQVVLFMKGTAQKPACGFSNFTVQVLQKLSIEFKDINVLENEILRQGIKDFTNWPTIPQLYIQQEFVGGADILRDLYTSGELFEMLDQKSISYQRPE